MVNEKGYYDIHYIFYLDSRNVYKFHWLWNDKEQTND